MYVKNPAQIALPGLKWGRVEKAFTFQFSSQKAIDNPVLELDYNSRPESAFLSLPYPHPASLKVSGKEGSNLIHTFMFPSMQSSVCPHQILNQWTK